MKKIALLAFLLAVCVAAGRAQESRQDISISGTALIEPFIASSTDVQVHSNRALGRWPATASCLRRPAPSRPTTASPTRTIFTIYANPEQLQRAHPHAGDSGAYVRSFVFKKFNPFVEAGPGALIFLPIRNSGTTSLDVKQQTEVGGIYGAGFAYEISPSFDIRAEYRGLITKVPTFGDAQFDHEQVVQHLQSGRSAWRTTSKSREQGSGNKGLRYAQG